MNDGETDNKESARVGVRWAPSKGALRSGRQHACRDTVYARADVENAHHSEWPVCLIGSKSNAKACLLRGMLVPGAAAAADPGRFLPSESALGTFSCIQEHKSKQDVQPRSREDWRHLTRGFEGCI